MHSILVIDDREDVRLKLQLLLQKAGFTVETVAGPAHAQILQRSTVFDVVLVDLNDPFESRQGQESLTYLINQTQKKLDCIYIPMTAWPSGESTQKASALGISNFVEKPVKAARVVQVIQQELEIRSLRNLNVKICSELAQLQKDARELPMMSLEEAEIQLIQQALKASDNNVISAAKLLGLTKSSLYRRLEKYGLAKPSQSTFESDSQTQH